jgi:hypothetical protein
MTFKGIRTNDRRKEKERLVNEALEEIHDKGFTKERGEEYQRRQTEWWNECDKWLNG